MFSPRFRSVSTALAPHQAHLSRQVHQSQQVAPRDCHLVLSLHAFKAAYHRSAHRRPGLRPGMYPLGHLPLGPADRVSVISSRACVNGATAGTACVLCHMRGDIARSTLGNKFSRIVVLVRTQRASPRGHWVLGSASSIIAKAASRSAVPVACVNVAITAKPCRFSVSA